MARVLQERLLVLAKDELPELQCGFRKGQSCTDDLDCTSAWPWSQIENVTFVIYITAIERNNSNTVTLHWPALSLVPSIYIVHSYAGNEAI